MVRIVNNTIHYSFVPTILWFGFVVAISFVETPIRFQVEQLERGQVLAIGHKVFHALNYCEMGFALLIGGCLLLGSWSRKCYFIGVTAILVLAMQTWLLFGILDERTLAQIAGRRVEPAPWHQLYIILELAKLGLLASLAYLQIQAFRRKATT